MASQSVESTRATGSPEQAQGMSPNELWAAFEVLRAEHAARVDEVDRCRSAYVEAYERAWEAWAVGRRGQGRN